MNHEYDVVIIGGAFSGAATALMLKRARPQLKIAVIERSEVFDRKVGEATTEVSGNFIARQLSLIHHLNHHHIIKQGLRFWFSNASSQDFSRCGEVGSFYQVRMPSYQVDRAVLDQHILDLAQAAGAEVLRPAKVTSVELNKASTVVVSFQNEHKKLHARWIIDASGRAAILARKLGTLHLLKEHPTNAIWARFRGVRDLDGHDLRSRYPDYSRKCQTSRAAATNHLSGYGWWCWIIPLKGGDTSAGLVYDERLFTPPAGETLGERLQAHLLSHPIGRELFAHAKPIEGDVKAYSRLPYFSEQIAGQQWQIVGDAAGFLDPLYSAGLDYCSWTVSSAVDRILKEHEGKTVDWKDINKRFLCSYHMWFQALYREKYRYIGDATLMTAAIFFDLGLFFVGPAKELVDCPKGGFLRFPFDGPVDRLVGCFMTFYNRRFALLAERWRAAGIYGASNLDHRTLLQDIEPTPRVFFAIMKGMEHWIRAEWRTLFLRKRETMPKDPSRVPAPAS